MDTGAPTHVARFTQRAADSNAAIMAHMNVSGVPMLSGAMMPLAMVETTSPPAIKAPALSNTMAIPIAPPMDNALAPTAGPMLLATSFAPMLSAIYAPRQAATMTIKPLLDCPKNNAAIRPAIITNTSEIPGPIIGRETYCVAASKLENRCKSRSSVSR